MTDRPARPSLLRRLAAKAPELVAASRRRFPWLDHLARAGGRYQRVQGDLLAAGVTYFAFLGLFPLLLLAAAVVGLVLSGNQVLQEQLVTAVREAVPGPTGDYLVEELTRAIQDAATIGLIGLVGFVYAGLRTMDKLRIGMETLWKGRVDEPDLIRDNLQDLLALVALGAVGLAGLGLTGGVTAASDWFLHLVGRDQQPGFGVLTWVLGTALAVLTNVLLFLWLLRVVPSIAVPVRGLLPGALFGAVGLEVLKQLGGIYLTLISGSVTASAFGGAVGILVWINVVSRFAFYTAAWTATLRVNREAVPSV